MGLAFGLWILCHPIVLLRKTFWASPRQSSSKLDSVLGSLQNWGGLEVTLLRSSIRNITFYTGTPFYFVPACILSSLRDFCLSCFTRHFGRHLGITNKFVLLSARSKIGLWGGFGCVILLFYFIGYSGCCFCFF